jgi:hypothetical protein
MSCGCTQVDPLSVAPVLFPPPSPASALSPHRSFGSILDRSVARDIVTILCELSLTSSKFLGQVYPLPPPPFSFSIASRPSTCLLSDSSMSRKDCLPLMLWVSSPPSSLWTTTLSSPLPSLLFKSHHSSRGIQKTISVNSSPLSHRRRSPCCS